MINLVLCVGFKPTHPMGSVLQTDVPLQLQPTQQFKMFCVLYDSRQLVAGYHINFVTLLNECKPYGQQSSSFSLSCVGIQPTHYLRRNYTKCIIEPLHDSRQGHICSFQCTIGTLHRYV